ncbi:MAG: tetratricopeptide repeat protein, partial [Longimicrobiales bacterium]
MTIRFPAGRAAVLLAALVSTGCATKGDLRDLQMELRAMAAQNDSLMTELRRQNRSTQDTIRRTSNQLFEIRGDVATRLGGIEDSLDRLAELVGQNQRTMASIRDQLEAGGRRGAGGGGFDDPMGGGTSPSDAVDLYNAAVGSYQQGSYSAARFGFEEFIDTFPADSLVPNAWFYLAEALVQLQEPDEAIDAYQQVIQNWPNSDSVPQARVGLGLTYLEQGDTTEARIQFETVVNTWPGTDAA